jgi:hypothetical protein
MNNSESIAEHYFGKLKFPLLFLRRGGSASNFILWNYFEAETGWLKRFLNCISTTSPKSMGIRRYPGYHLVHMDLGTPPVQEENFSAFQSY